MTDITVARTGYGNLFHLHVPGYRPSSKRRAVPDRVALCNMLIDLASPVPLAEALTRTPPLPLSPRRGGGGGTGEWSWCRSCIGHAVGLLHLEAVVLEIVLDVAQEAPPP